MDTKFWFAARFSACVAASFGAMLLAALGPAMATAEIYRTVDEHGNVVFTDIPPPSGQTSESVTINPVNTFAVPAPAVTAPPVEADVPEVAHYDSIRILTPANDATVRENAGNVTVAVALIPPLRAGDRLVLYMDGNQSPVRAQGASFQLENVDRGSHTIGVRVLDDSGRVAAEAETSTFHLQRVSALRPTLSAG